MSDQYVLQTQGLGNTPQIFNADAFVSDIRLMDNSTLMQRLALMHETVLNVPAESFQARMKASWMIGAYRREAKARGLEREVARCFGS